MTPARARVMRRILPSGSDRFPTELEALEEARRRWGPTAKVWTVRTDFYAPHRVGLLVPATSGGCEPQIMGRGLTWDRAFASADNRAARATMTRKSTRTPRVDPTKPAPVVLEQLELLSPPSRE